MTDSHSCSRCGAPIAPGAHFCPSCGLDISGSQGGVATVNVTAPLATLKPDALLEALRQAALGEYEVLAELGRGGMATVYLAHDIALDRKIAIKVMSPVLLTGEGMVERFKREARTAGQLSHPHIIPIYAVRESGGLLYFVMKFVEGRPLDSIIREIGQLPIPMVQTILQQVGSALGYAHRRGVIHRDIKPANIMIDADGWAVVTDFGIAKVSQTQGLTVTGATVGTPSYMSPEQCAAKELDGASDQYSLGVVAYEMLSGKLPFVAESVMAVMYAHFNEPPPPIQLARPDCPPNIAAAVMRMLEKEPDSRFPTIDVAVAAIGGAPLAPDDPIRTQMMTLAAKSEGVKLLGHFNTPVSQPSAIRSERQTGTRPSVATLAISPGRVTLAVGDAVQLRAAPKSRDGRTLAGRPVSWASTNTDVARVSPNGLVTAIGPGTVTLTATSEGASATATVSVTAGRSLKKRVAIAAGGLGLAGIAVALWVFGPRGRTAAGPGSGSDTGIVASAPTPETQAPVTQTDTSPPPTPGQSDITSPTQPPSQAAARPPGRLPQRNPDADEATVATALRTARAARDQAVVAGATDADLAAGDAELSTALRLRQARGGRSAEALQHLLAATNLWAAAERTVQARAAAASRPAEPVPPPTQPATPPAPQPVADPAPQIREVITAYGRALENRDLNALRQVFPALPSHQAQAWQDLFNSARDIRADLRPTQIDQSGDRADVAVSGMLTYQNTNARRQERLPANFHARLARVGSSWVITAIQ
ncbi:MAG: protein kinase domain-containing protein [Gemmatimonadales bacterium]